MMGRRLRSPLDLLKPDLGKRVLDRQEKMLRNHKTRSYPIFKEGDPVFLKNFAAGPSWFPASVIHITGPVSAKVQLDRSNVVWNQH